MSAIQGFPIPVNNAPIGGTPPVVTPQTPAVSNTGGTGERVLISNSPIVGTQAQASAATQVIGTDSHAAERAERNQIMGRMLEGSTVRNQTPQDRHRRDVISHGMDGFSIAQLRQMDQAHVKIVVDKTAGNSDGGTYHADSNWVRHDLPYDMPPDDGRTHPEDKFEDDVKGSPRTITLDPSLMDDTTPTGQADAQHAVRHHMAHAWDDVGGTTDSANPQRKIYRDGDGRSWSVQDMYQDYRQRLDGHPERVIDSHHTQKWTSATSPTEFYSEAYAVFHGDDPQARRDMAQACPAMYEYLHADAFARGTMPQTL